MGVIAISETDREQYRAGRQDLDSLTRSVMHYYGRPRDALEPWSAAVVVAMGQLSKNSSGAAGGAA